MAACLGCQNCFQRQRACDDHILEDAEHCPGQVGHHQHMLAPSVSFINHQSSVQHVTRVTHDLFEEEGHDHHHQQQRQQQPPPHDFVKITNMGFGVKFSLPKLTMMLKPSAVLVSVAMVHTRSPLGGYCMDSFLKVTSTFVLGGARG